MPTPHQWKIRVYYEDTDAGGVVYYANYLKYAERARTELLRASGINQATLAYEKNIYFVVRHAELDISKPARLDDELTIHTEVISKKGASVTMQQTILREQTHLALINVKIACINSDFKPTKLPEGMF